MSDLETTQSKLRSTPTAGVAGEHSAYYRHLLSAGYKGHIQGMIGGATLYGVMGLAVGALVALPILPFAGTAVLMAIPAMGGIGLLHGATTFADIGKTAAIIAESADINEKRRYLLDRYYETPSDEEAQAIRTMLQNQMQPRVPEKMFHWKTVVIGAILGLAITAGFMWLTGILGGAAVAGAAEAAGHGVMLESIFQPITTYLTAHGIGALGVAAIGTALGTAAGALIGLDREYVRRWLDHAEVAVHDQTRIEQQIAERAREANQLSEAALRGLRQQAELSAASVKPTASAHAPVAPQLARPDPVPPTAVAGIARPAPTISEPQLQDRVAIQHAMQTPVV